MKNEGSFFLCQGIHECFQKYYFMIIPKVSLFYMTLIFHCLTVMEKKFQNPKVTIKGS